MESLIDTSDNCGTTATATTTADLLYLQEKPPVVIDVDSNTALDIFVTSNNEETKRQHEFSSDVNDDGHGDDSDSDGTDDNDGSDDSDSDASDERSNNEIEKNESTANETKASEKEEEEKENSEQLGESNSKPSPPIAKHLSSVTDDEKDKFTALLEALPFQEPNLKIILAGARLGLLHEILALQAIIHAIPQNDNNNSNTISNPALPNIIRHFKDDSEKTGIRIRKFYKEAIEGDEFSLLFANLSAYMYWDYVWFAKRRYNAKLKYERTCITTNPTKAQENARTFSPSLSAPLKPTGVAGGSSFPANNSSMKPLRHDCNVWDWTPQVHDTHNEWCRKNGINPVRVRLVSKTIHKTLNTLFQYRFESECEWIRCADPIPIWRKMDKWHGRTGLSHNDMLLQVYGKVNGPLLCRSLQALCENGSTCQSLRSCGKIVMPALEMVATHEDWKDCPVRTPQEQKNGESLRIVNFFKSKGKRVMGNRVVKAAVKRSAAVATAVVGNTIKRPQTSLYEPAKLKKVRSELAHWFCEAPDTPLLMPINTKRKTKGNTEEEEELEICQAIAPILSSMKIVTSSSWWIRRNSPSLLLLGDGNFDFAKALGFMGYRPKYATTLEARSSKSQPSERGRLRGIDATRVHRNYRIKSAALNGEVETFVWNFPYLDNPNATDQDHEALILGTFYSLGILYDSLYDVDALAVLLRPFQFGLALHDDQFSKWSVLRAAERGGWRLKSWGAFDSQAFPGYRPKTSTGEDYPVKNATFYVFQYMEGYLELIGPSVEGRMY